VAALTVILIIHSARLMDNRISGIEQLLDSINRQRACAENLFDIEKALFG